MRVSLRTGAVLGSAVLLLSACSSQFGSNTESKQDDAGQQRLSVMIASSADAEANAVKKAVAAWEKRTGNKATIQSAQNLQQQLGQSLAGGEPPDVFYVPSDQFANYAQGGSLLAYGDRVKDVESFSENLRASFVHEGELVCVPKDSSTLALAINTDLWKKAGLTDKDIPGTWEELADVAGKLTQGKVTGLVFDPTYNRIGAFMRQNGGWVTDDRQTKVTADTDQNVKALEYVRKLLRDGSLKYSKQVDAGWGGEAFGKGRAAMTIEGNWLTGALRQDFPDVDYKMVELPAGPAGKGTLSFSTCWGVAKKSSHHKAAIDLVESLTEPRTQLDFAAGFGVMPSRDDALAGYTKEFPEHRAFVEGAPYAQGPVTLAGFQKVLAKFDTDLGSLRTADPRKILADLQRNAERVLEDGR